jgi:uncharacterized protein HemY
MIGRAAWIALLAAIALVTTFAQLDRAARFAPDLAASVPAPFRGFAAEQLARKSIGADDAEESLRAARALLRARPMPAENLTLLARAELLAGDEEAALAALQAAAGRGWREPFAQRAMAEAALESGDAQVAEQRIAALRSAQTLDREELADLERRLAEIRSEP